MYSIPMRYQKALLEALTMRNNKIIEYNFVMMQLRGCNMANYFLSTEAAAKVAVFYLLSYLLKNQSDRTATLAIAQKAKIDAQKFPSVASDTGTATRSAQHELTKIMNAFNNQGEYTAMYAAYCIIGGEPEPISHSTTSLNVHNAFQLLTEIRIQKGNPILEEKQDDEEDPN
jgi:hypothetical protein